MSRTGRYFPRFGATFLMATATLVAGWAVPPALTDLGTPLLHPDRVLAVAWTPDGKLVAACRDGSVLVWDADVSKMPVTLKGDGAVFTRAVAVNPGPGSSILSGGRDKTVSRWSLAGGSAEGKVKGAGPVRSLAASPDRTRVVVGTGSTVQVWDATSPTMTALPGAGSMAQVAAVAWGGDGTTSPTDGPIAAGDVSGSIFLWKGGATKDNPVRIQTPTSGPVTGLAFVPPGSGTLLSVGGGGRVRRWTLPAAEPVAAKAGHPITRFAAATDGSTIATGGDSFAEIRRFDASPPATIPLVAGESLANLALAQDGGAILCAVATKPLRYYKGGDPKSLKEIKGSSSDATALALRLSRDATTKTDTAVAAAGSGRTVTIYTATVTDPTPAGGDPDPTVVKIGPLTDDISALAFDPAASGRGSLYIAAGRTVVKWDLASTTTPVVTFDGTSGHTDVVRCLGPSADGKTLSTGSDDKTVRLWQADGTFLARLGAGDDVTSVAFAADGKGLTATTASSVRFWDVSVPRSPHALQDLSVGAGTAAIGAAPSSGPGPGTTVLTAWSDDVRVWTPAAAGFLDPGSDLGRGLAVATDAIGKRAAAGFEKKAVVLFDLATGSPPQTLADHDGPVLTAVFASDAQLVTATKDQALVRAIPPAMPGPSSVQLEMGRQVASLSATTDTLLIGYDNGTAQVSKLDPSGASGKTMLGTAGADAANAVAVLAPDPSLSNARFAIGSEDQSISLWGAPSASSDPSKPTRTYNAKAEVFGLDWVPVDHASSTRFVAASGDGFLRIWDAGSGTPLVEKPALEKAGDPPGRVFAVAANKTRVALGTDKPSVQIWDVSAGTFQAAVSGTSIPTRTVRSLAFNAAGDTLAIGSDDQTVRLCREDGTMSRRLGDHPAPVVAVAFDPDRDNFLASVDSGGTLIVWNVTTSASVIQDGQLAARAEIPLSLAWSPDGSKLAVGVVSNKVILFRVTLPP